MSPLASFVPAVKPAATPQPAVNPRSRTVWGLSPEQLHDRFWAARGVQVVRQGERSALVADAELFLLTDPRSLVIFRLGPLLETLGWLKPDLLLVRLQHRAEQSYREVVVDDAAGRFVRFQRVYGGSDMRLARVALTADPEMARQWQGAADVRMAWRTLRRHVRRAHRVTASTRGSAYDRTSDHELMDFLRRLVQVWKQPQATIPRARRVGRGVWADPGSQVSPRTRFLGESWIGAGRHLEGTAPVVGPAVLWDDPAARPPVEDLHWQEIEPTDVLARSARPPRRSGLGRLGKRAFDFVAALLALTITLPFYPLVMLAIWLEDGRPFFFAHRRETRGARPFPCLKFRSMRRDAEQIKAQLQQLNKADGPQFFMGNDPRLTRVGRIIRNLYIDEWPQFLNVLLGHMSLVGPRPSPFAENQFCPAWREARLSVRPGITGLWQVMRSRRQGLDFQEWIRYDLDYVERGNWRLDLWILWKTVGIVIGKVGGK